ncbi:S-layer homology domain-containing protein [Fusibacter paucivorans]|uniref:S-layer homology domain-containing protein n=1 Tax=Fusibacter paucivorans TaxID=76009 RepID=A0ABS5PS82_9FIRM|nr:S-layer homology domain-containing protein [Fusibacter paucivorans]MBS7526922.1 S-layer homology domain-containing protein [Fusibacter paucivorans]
MKKIALFISLCIVLTISAAFAAEDVSLTVYLDGQELVTKDMMVRYMNADGSYGEPGELNKAGNATVLIKTENDRIVYCLSQEMTLTIGDNELRFNTSELSETEIVIGPKMHVMDDMAMIMFENGLDAGVTVSSGQTTKIYYTPDLIIDHVGVVNVMGNTGINMSLKGDYHFDAAYYLKAKTPNVLMPERPSFEALFDICFGDDVPINEFFVMGPGGGCDYQYIDENGNIALEARFGRSNNPLHFEDLNSGIYDMIFSFHDGDMVLTAKNIAFVNDPNETVEPAETDEPAAVDEPIITDEPAKAAPYVVKVSRLPFVTDNIDFHALMERPEQAIIFEYDGNIDGNVMIYDNIKLFAEFGKVFSIKTDYVKFDFDSAAIAEMEKTTRDLSIHIKNDLATYSKQEIEDFMNETYPDAITEEMALVSSYDVRVYLSEHDLIAGPFNNRPTLTFYPNDADLKDIDLRKVQVYSDANGKNTLRSIGGMYKDGGITVALHEPIPYYYFNLYENNITFKDVEGSWAKDYIEVMASKNIINGFEKMYKPTDTLTKAQFIVLLTKVIDTQPMAYKGTYKDCSAQDWFTPYVEAAYSLGLIDAASDGLFNPNTAISRQDMIVAAIKAYDSRVGSLRALNAVKPFTDEASIDNEALNYVKTAVQLGLISGMPDGSFAPDAPLTREQAAVIIYHLMDVIK